MQIDCKHCGGRHGRHQPFCPVLQDLRSRSNVKRTAKQDFFGASPNIFIGRFGYPHINVGLLSTEHYSHHDDPLHWSGNNFQIPQIVDLRTELINSGFSANVKTFKDRFIEMSREISMAEKPVDVEVHLSRKPHLNINYVRDAAPHGPKVRLEEARITENPKIPTKVEKVTSDTDLKASEALRYLSKKGTDEHYLTKLISLGNLGVGPNRKLVPTRWAITAVDDTLGKQIIIHIKDLQSYDYAACFGGYLGNYYLILFFPEIWSYELFETALGNRPMTGTDHEFYDGRKTYASETAGGYYASRLAVLQHLKSLKRQASVLVLRFITNEYYAPLGVWVVREATRKALSSRSINFGSKELMLQYAKALVRKKFGYDTGNLLKVSKLLQHQRNQSKLSSFI
ncbi:MAG: hypothetical protein ACE5DM_01695 [Candidatus Nanoarchaeia archaeon]